MKKHAIISFFLFYISGFLLAQDHLKSLQYISPLNVPLVLSGNFGELRTNHFHSGLDFRTNGKTGLPVKVVADGTISRIKISPVGYGKALYIDHPNGTTSVYGHLHSFNDSIEQYIKELQYKKESFDIDISVPKGKFNFKQGELIARSGNSGSSAGPHLHFEIRETKTQQVLNPLKFGYELPDNIKPIILSLYIYPLTDSSHVNGSKEKKRFETVYYDGKFHVKKNPLIKVYGNIGFGLETIDYIDGSWSKCGIYSMEVQLDQQKVYEFAFDRLDFSTMRYINSHIDYEQKFNTGRNVHKTYREPGNKLELYNDSLTGILKVPNPVAHKVHFYVKDLSGNTAQLDIRVRSKKIALEQDSVQKGTPFNFEKVNKFETSNFKLFAPKGCFYNDFRMLYEVDSIRPKNAFSAIHKVHNFDTPVQKFMEIAIRPDSIPPHLQSKALLASVERNGKLTSMGGVFEKNWVKAQLRSFGNYCVTLDTITPKIRPLSIQNNNTLTDRKKIRFKIKDDFSDISFYKGTIDGKWVLFEFDAKNDLLTYVFDESRIEFKKQHKLVLEVRDAKDNVARYEATFIK